MERHKIAAVLMTWALLIGLTAYGAAEGRRMAIAKERQTRDAAYRGASTYALACSACHGPLGEGAIGPPLNRPKLRGDPRRAADTLDFLYRTVARGRPGTSSPFWVRTPDGRWASQTAMPFFGKEDGGPYTPQQLRDVVSFLMAGEWTWVGGLLPAPEIPAPAAAGQPAPLLTALPDAPGLDAAANARAKVLLREKGCLSCHFIGSAGGRMGPTLDTVGSWGLDEATLRAWITDPKTVPPRERGPSSWTVAGLDLPMLAPVMPAYPMPAADLDAIVAYLMALKDPALPPPETPVRGR